MKMENSNPNGHRKSGESFMPVFMISQANNATAHHIQPSNQDISQLKHDENQLQVLDPGAIEYSLVPYGDCDDDASPQLENYDSSGGDENVERNYDENNHQISIIKLSSVKYNHSEVCSSVDFCQTIQTIIYVVV